MKLLDFFKMTEYCQPLHCALSRTRRDPCWLKKHRPAEYTFALSEGLVKIRKSGNSYIQPKLNGCVAFTPKGRNVFRQLKGDFT